MPTASPSAGPSNDFPANPVVVRVHRAGAVESQHRGAWCLVDDAGSVLAGAGAHAHPFFVRSSIKVLQALPLLESGGAERYSFTDEELALAIASHSGEPCHTSIVRATLARLGLGPSDLQCGAHAPFDEGERAALRARGEAPGVLHNNCSGKHAGFLALARALGAPTAAYLEPDGAVQVAVREALSALSGRAARELVPGIDGCSAPTYRLPLSALATAFARVTNPEGLSPQRAAHLRRLTTAARLHPHLVGGSSGNLDTEILRASGGRLFAKIGAEGVHAIGVVGGRKALALKIDDGGSRALHALVIALLEKLALASSAELERLKAWREPTLRNFAGREIGRIEPLVETLAELVIE